MVSDLIHPAMLDELPDFFPSTCTIQTNAETVDADGVVIDSWSDLAGHVDIACSVTPKSGEEVQQGDATYLAATDRIALQGYYSTITEKMRAVVGTTTYDILKVDGSSHEVLTALICRRVDV